MKTILHVNSTNARRDGLAMIILGIYLNIPFSILGATFSYPGILRRPVGEVLERFHSGGAALIFTWYAFALAAALMLPMALRMRGHATRPDGTLARMAAVSGALAGVFQTVGLIRWVFAVPALASAYTAADASPATREAVAVVFQALHQFVGVAIGEHLGQVCTALWAIGLALSLPRAGGLATARMWLGLVAALLILAGLSEGFATVIPFDPGLLGAATPVGYILLSLWMVAVGAALRSRSAAGASGGEVGQGKF